MRNRLFLIAMVVMSASLFAQVPVPGTFTSVPAQQVQVGMPILSPPIATLGNGLTPAVVTTKHILVVGAPQNVPLEPEMIAPTTSTGGTVTTAPEASLQPSAAGEASAAQRYFDFVVAVGGAEFASPDTHSLGDVARTLRKSGAPAFSGRTLTNDDVNRMNQKYPAGAVPAPQRQQQQPNNPVQGTTPQQ